MVINAQDVVMALQYFSQLFTELEALNKAKSETQTPPVTPTEAVKPK